MIKPFLPSLPTLPIFPTFQICLKHRAQGTRGEGGLDAQPALLVLLRRPPDRLDPRRVPSAQKVNNTVPVLLVTVAALHVKAAVGVCLTAFWVL